MAVANIITAVFVISMFLLVYSAYNSSGKNRSTRFIEDNNKQIGSLLKGNNLRLYYGTKHNMFGITYTSIKEGKEEYQLSSNKIKMLIIRLKRGELRPSEVVQYCERFGTPIHSSNITEWDEL